ncbi:MAG: ATP-binding protein [Candidatus Woesearchaeota archaeon]
MSELQFSEEDIIRTISELESPVKGLGFILHEFTNYIIKTRYVLKDNNLEKDKEEYNKTLEKYIITTKNLKEIITEKYKSDDKSKLNSTQEITLLKNMHAELNNMIKWYNAFFDKHKSEDKITKEMTFHYESLIYLANQRFSKNFKKEFHIVNRDLGIFYSKLYQYNELKQGLEGILDVELEDTIKTFEDYTLSVIKPIIDNALEHGKCSNIIISGEEIDKKTYQITIINDGKKIDLENIEDIFIEGVTTRSEKKDHGIGLSYAKHFIEKNNGTISVISSDKETSFKFTIPCTKESSAYYVQILP